MGLQSQSSSTHNAHVLQISSPSAKESECSMSFRTWAHLYGRPVGQAGPDLDYSTSQGRYLAPYFRVESWLRILIGVVAVVIWRTSLQVFKR